VRDRSPRQEIFIQLCAELGNRTQAYIRAGYHSKHPNKAAYDLAHDPHISRRIQEAIDAEIGGKAGILARLAQHADANLKDFEPFLTGKKTLGRLAMEGVNVGVVKSATVQSVKVGKKRRVETRKIVLHNSQEAAWKLARLGGYGEGGRDPDEPKPAEVHVTVVNGRILSRQMEELAALPSAPGLPAGDRFAEQGASPLFGNATVKTKPAPSAEERKA